MPIEDITISQRIFPARVRADLQRAVDAVIGKEYTVQYFTGVRREYEHESMRLANCLDFDSRNAVQATPPEYAEMDVGDEQPLRVLKRGLWLLERDQARFVVLMTPAERHGDSIGVEFHIGAPNTPAGTSMIAAFFEHLEKAVAAASTYRGKILSLEHEDSYSGLAAGIKVHQLRTVTRDEVILPAATLDLLDRNIIQFVRRRPELARYRQSTRKGLLFYGPPGTGKTHTIHYLARELPGHTTLLITAEQIGWLSQYMTLARLLQPSVVVIEDVDLVARNRSEMRSGCEESLLNDLLNEMDGLKSEADILFVLTTNRPEALEAALASRPGRIDQAIEFPLPDAAGREKLLRLYSHDVVLSSELTAELVKRTDGVSAAFIKELLRRMVQFHIERANDGVINSADADAALNEMLITGGRLSLRLLGANAWTSTES